MVARALFPGFGQLARPVTAAEGRSGVVAFVGPQEVLQLPLGAPLGRESAYLSSPNVALESQSAVRLGCSWAETAKIFGFQKLTREHLCTKGGQESDPNGSQREPQITPKLIPKRAPNHPKIDPGGGLAPLWGANWARLAYLTRFGGQLEDSGARSGGGQWSQRGQKKPKGSPMGCQGEPKEAQKGAWSEGWAADGPCSASCRELWAGIRKTTKNLVFYRLRVAWRGAKWTLFGAPEELFRPTGSPLRARRGVLEASASAAGRFRAVFDRKCVFLEPQWLRKGCFRAFSGRAWAPRGTAP